MGPLRTGSLESLRERNRLRVIDALRTRGAISRADIARQTGLSRSTVSSLVADLQATGMVIERATDGVAATASQGGRPPVLVALDRSAGAVVGLDFGHDSLRVAVADLSYSILAESYAELEVDTAAVDALDTAATLVSELIDEAGVDRGRVLAAGMGLPGPIDRESGRVHSQPILPGWVALDPAAEMEERLGLPVHLDNDANVGALGESTFGVGRGTHVMAYLRLSAGIGAGLVINGRPFRGARGIAGEIGHVLVDPQGPICRCGNRGCLETFVAGPALCELLRRSHGPLTVRQLLAAGPGGRRRLPARRSPTPAASSAAPSPTSATTSTRTSSSWAAISAPPATSCSSRCARPCGASPSRPPPRTSRSSPARSATAPSCSARSPSPAMSPKTH